jgi:hypothetical protein
MMVMDMTMTMTLMLMATVPAFAGAPKAETVPCLAHRVNPASLVTISSTEFTRNSIKIDVPRPVPGASSVTTKGGALYMDEVEQRLTGVTFTNNSCVLRGWSPQMMAGSVLAGGAVFFEFSESDTFFTNVKLSGNWVTAPCTSYGGALSLAGQNLYFSQVVVEPYSGLVPVNTTIQTVFTEYSIIAPTTGPTRVRQCSRWNVRMNPQYTSRIDSRGHGVDDIPTMLRVQSVICSCPIASRRLSMENSRSHRGSVT